MWSVVSAILPKRVADKFEVVDPLSDVEKRKKLWKYISDEDLPEKYGGKNKVEEEEDDDDSGEGVEVTTTRIEI
eukprot:CAMPEP_0194032626 /NCGR_PEP_ID=MMETSP0009_2-20130614/5526_1 /TAXON_ID=210454 /ORGANISM="Grammatophora oceanica, Strain CCMP 410" /LENGTH=73 /DNA_ID=CAMNT_0038673125 /DNA_START=41 /DNA_END=262 /DNA_ORIENTATION=-